MPTDGLVSTDPHEPADTPRAVVHPDTMLAVLDALARMARASRRHEADFDSAVRGAGLVLTPEQRDAALRQLVATECVERVIPLLDGGLLMSVTRTGMSRAGIMA